MALGDWVYPPSHLECVHQEARASSRGDEQEGEQCGIGEAVQHGRSSSSRVGSARSGFLRAFEMMRGRDACLNQVGRCAGRGVDAAHSFAPGREEEERCAGVVSVIVPCRRLQLNRRNPGYPRYKVAGQQHAALHPAATPQPAPHNSLVVDDSSIREAAVSSSVILPTSRASIGTQPTITMNQTSGGPAPT